MSPTPHPVLRRALVASKCAIVAALAFFAVGTASASSTEGITAAQAIPEQAAGHAHLDKLISRHDCSLNGFGADVIPGSSLVLKGDKVRHVSFDAGWAIYLGEQPGTLLALCRVTV